ncbi:MAG: transcriptional repressor [Actinomycetales bacterium]|nr:transcriptional repressor [Actinomycetales bacterium]
MSEPAAIGVRSTRQRSAIADVLREQSGFHSAQEYFDLLRNRGQRIGLTTVYRTLQALVASGDVDMLVGADGEARYRGCGQALGHHHHLVCRQCGRTVEIAATEVEQWASSVAVAHGFTSVDHTVELVGTCRNCAGDTST